MLGSAIASTVISVIIVYVIVKFIRGATAPTFGEPGYYGRSLYS